MSESPSDAPSAVTLPAIGPLTIPSTISLRLAGFVCLLLFLLGFYIESLDKNLPAVPLAEVQSIETCSRESGSTNDLLKIAAIKDRASALHLIQDACYDKGYKQAELNEFQIRRMQFLEQYYDARVLLWMVVAITLSGVVLAGIQLAASYQLALNGKVETITTASEMSAEHSKLVLRSSVIGIFILIISFAFFFIFATQMYPAKEIDLDGQRASQQPHLVPNLVPVQMKTPSTGPVQPDSSGINKEAQDSHNPGVK